MRVRIALVLVLTIFLGLGAAAAPKLGDADRMRIRELAQKIIASQTPEGVFAMDATKTRAVPYFAHFAALGLIRASALTGERSYLVNVRRHLDWYASAMRPDGTVCDYALKDGKLASTGDFDSSDSYASGFLVVSWEYYTATRDRKWLLGKQHALEQALKAIELTLQSDGLTYAKPNYHAKYLMDNLEVWQGLKAGQKLAAALNNSSLQAKFTSRAEQTKRGLASFWLASKGHFAMVIFEDGNKDERFDRWYPDGMANAMAAGILLDPKDEASRALVGKIMKAFPGGGDWIWWTAARKFRSESDAEAARARMAKSLQYSMDYGNLIRTYNWDADSFLFQDGVIPLARLRK